MYLTLSHPEVIEKLKLLGGGIWPAQIGDKYCLIVKVSKEAILATKVNKSFSFYLAPVLIDDVKSFGLVTAFFDDADQPLACKTPLVEDKATDDLLELCRSDEIEAFFFDENNRELLSYKVKGNLTGMLQKLSSVPFLSVASAREALDQMEFWFGTRSSKDNDEAYRMELTESLFPDDFVIMDLDIDKHSFVGSQSFSSNALEREVAGAPQELDIVFLMQRVFPAERIFLNPIKKVDGKEFVDVLVVGDEIAILIQAKDSPNTEKILKNTIERKKSKSLAQLKEASVQLKGAVAFVEKDPVLHFTLDGHTVKVDLTDVPLLGIAVIKEIFTDQMVEYSEVVFSLMAEAQTPVLFFDYPELNLMTMHCPSEERFLSAVDQILQGAHEHGEMPRLRYSGKPPSN